MAKKRANKESESYQSDKELRPLSASEIREWTARLAKLQSTLEQYASDMDQLKIEHVMCFKKTIPNALNVQEEWIKKQFIPRLGKAAGEAGAEVKLQIVLPSQKVN